MAISRGAGTEIIRSASFEDIDGDTSIIIGEQHHIYTVLSIIVFALSLNTEGDKIGCWVLGYDSEGGTTQQNIHIFNQSMNTNETFVFNDKFSFMGFEPVSFTGPLSTLAEQDAIADQGSSAVQHLQMTSTSSSDSFEVHVTFIDQNNE
jgi:hypothetical protein